MDDDSSYRVLSSGRRVQAGASSVSRVLKSGRRLGDNEPVQKKQRTLFSQIGSILHENDDSHHQQQQQQQQDLSSKIQVGERKQRENEPTKKLLMQAVSDANKSVLMKLNKRNGVVEVMKPDGTTECLTTKTLMKRLKAKEPTWVDPASLIQKAEPTLGKMKIQIRNEYCSTTNPDDDNKSNEQPSSSMEFEDDDEDEFVVVVNNDDDINNIWMLNDYPHDTSLNDYDESKGNGSFKRKLSDDMSDENDEQQYSPASNQQTASAKKSKRCRFWPDCHNGDQCEFVHPTQRCTHFPNCAYGAECLYIHPTCRFAGACTRSDCPYLHSTVTPASSPNDNATTPGRSSANNRSEICKFGVQCMRPNCIYSHPRMPFPPNRNYKWVNSKWSRQTPDDTPFLPTTPKNLVYENPFVSDKSSSNKSPNSNEDSIEK